MLGEFLVITAWSVLRLRMEGRPPDGDRSCECIEYQSRTADKGLFFSLGAERETNNPSP
jgi:hypothetical protein